MMVCRGEIWLVNLISSKKQNEMSKVRPVVVFQNNELNHSDYPTTIIIPLSTSLVDDTEPLRMRISKREDLQKDSDIVVTQIRAIDNCQTKFKFRQFILCDTLIIGVYLDLKWSSSDNCKHDNRFMD